MLLVVFGLMDDYPEPNLRHYTFMLEGLKESSAALASRGIKMILDCLRPGLSEAPARLAQAGGQASPLPRGAGGK
jgi:hypothetical protein